MNKETYMYLMDLLREQRDALRIKRCEHISSSNASGCFPSESFMHELREQFEENEVVTLALKAEYDADHLVKINLRDVHVEPVVSPYDFGFTDKSSALKSIKQDIAKSYPFVMHYDCKDEMLTYFATLLMNYSNHDKRDIEIALKEIEHGRIYWQLTADHEILDAGNYIIDKDVPF